jgi:hypothetical protein
MCWRSWLSFPHLLRSWFMLFVRRITFICMKKAEKIHLHIPTLGRSLFSIVSTKFTSAHVLRERYREARTIFGCFIFKSLNSFILTFFSVTIPNSTTQKCK